MTNPLAPGFVAAGVAAGLKSSGALDVALIVNEGPGCTAAGVFTQNKIKAAPVLWSKQVLADGDVRAVALNSGGANACTGPQGFADTHATAEHVADLIGCGAGDVAVCSTGLIGVALPMPELLAGFTAAAEAKSAAGGPDAAHAIMTTDSVAKTARVEVDGVVVAGMAKGAGMLAPGLATMLVVLTTDAVATSATLQQALAGATNVTFDRLDSDGCMSTNDTVLLLASGVSGVTLDPSVLSGAVTSVCADLARQLISDAEGASKEIKIEVVNAATEADAVEVAREIARSNLFKCAVHGEDANWGRVISAAGTADADFEADQIAVRINGVWVCRSGMAAESRDLVDMSARDVEVVVDLMAGSSTATIWTNDLTAAYVHENSAYST